MVDLGGICGVARNVMGDQRGGERANRRLPLHSGGRRECVASTSIGHALACIARNHLFHPRHHDKNGEPKMAPMARVAQGFIYHNLHCACQ